MKGCFGAINVENEIEIEKFWNKYHKTLLPYIVGNNSSLLHSFSHIKVSGTGRRCNYGFANVMPAICHADHVEKQWMCSAVFWCLF